MMGELERAGVASPAHATSGWSEARGVAAAADVRAVVAGVIDLEQDEVGDRARPGVEARGAWADAAVAEGGEDGGAVLGLALAVAGVGAGGRAGAAQGGSGGRAGTEADGAGREVSGADATEAGVGVACVAVAGGTGFPEADGEVGAGGADAADGAEGARGSEEIALPPVRRHGARLVRTGSVVKSGMGLFRTESHGEARGVPNWPRWLSGAGMALVRTESHGETRGCFLVAEE